MKMCISKKVSKKTIWIALIALGLPLFITGIKVWSQQESDSLRYAAKAEMATHELRITEMQVVVKHLAEDIQEIKDGQAEAREDRREILRQLEK